jgi:adenosylcobyric acid synthase
MGESGGSADGNASDAGGAGNAADARTLLVAGTASHVGKSTVAAGLCRWLADRGVDVAPFKAQNMSNNAHVALRPDGEWGEIGVSQYVQARAARVPATTDHNPVLLKPRGEGESQLVVDGEAVGHFAAGAYYDRHWETALDAAKASHARLAADHEVVVAEGAGSIAEINLQHRDLANVETARFADADVLLVADIERGGAFASLVGTLELMPADLRSRVVGAVITKFRGDRSILDPGLDEFDDRTGVPVLGVLPYDDPGLPEEDSVSLPAPGETTVIGTDTYRGTESEGTASVNDTDPLTVAVPRLPRASNVTDVEPLARESGVVVRFQPLDAPLGDADGVVLTGTKNSVDDLLAATEAGLGDQLRTFDGPIVGLCGGYQLLGERIERADIEGTGSRETVAGFGLLPVVTTFEREKQVERVTHALDGAGPFAGASGEVTGYEIHMGSTTHRKDCPRPLGGTSAVQDSVLGTYLHGCFEHDELRRAFVEAMARGRDADLSVSASAVDRSSGDPYDAAATLLDEHMALDQLFDVGE